MDEGKKLTLCRTVMSSTADPPSSSLLIPPHPSSHFLYFLLFLFSSIQKRILSLSSFFSRSISFSVGNMFGGGFGGGFLFSFFSSLSHFSYFSFQTIVFPTSRVEV